MKAILLLVAITGGLLSFNSYASGRDINVLSFPLFLSARGATDADIVCFSKPVIKGTFAPYYIRGGNYYINYQHCVYVAQGVIVSPENPDPSVGMAADWKPIAAVPPHVSMDEAHIQEPKPEKPDTSSAEQLLAQWLACSKDCGGIKQQLLNAMSSGTMLSPNATKTNFYTKDSGILIKCSPAVDGSTYLVGQYSGYSYMNQAQVLHAANACNSVYDSVMGDKPDDNPDDNGGNKPGDGDDNKPGDGDDNKPGDGDDNNPGDDSDNPGTGGGSGSGSTDNNDNGDVVAAIDRFHADNNASHKQLLDELKKKDDYSDTTNKLGDMFTNGISDFKSGAESSVNSLIDGLDKYAPGLKGFGLPDGFYSGGGRCVPLDMSFSFTVPMVNYHVPVKLSTDNVCKFYDGYPRELLRMLIYMLTVFVLIALLKQSLK